MDNLRLPCPLDESLHQRVRNTLDSLRQELLDQQGAEGHWTGQLSASALSTATAVSSFAAVLDHHGCLTPDEATRYRELIGRGMSYLRSQQNLDGGFGDTDRSHSNIATSYLVQAASTLARRVGDKGLSAEQSEKLQEYVCRSGGIDGLRRRYGTDKTFVVPILTNLAIAGLVSWDEVAALPFEAAVFPQPMYRFLRVPVVSYAIPALVAIGQARHFHGRRTWLPLRLLRKAAVPRTMRVLQRMQPESGGYLEATPLTSFVVMSLAATGRADCTVARRGLRFLEDSAISEALSETERAPTESAATEGPASSTACSWPIDTNLATWVTSLSIHALAADPQDDRAWARPELLQWLLRCQHQQRHPFTGAEPGGWGWTNLSGAVPDGDDTPAAILALAALSPHASFSQQQEIDEASRRGIRWLIRLQNRNGGWPTFCRGWGKLPFDRSSTDLTAHAIRALSISQVSSRGWRDRSRIAAEGAQSGSGSKRAIESAIAHGEQFLASRQRADGSWLPLWFGNQDNEDDENPVYGTARALLASRCALSRSAVTAGTDFLIRQQNSDGGWGGGPSLRQWIDQQHTDRQHGTTGSPVDGRATEASSSVEETALAVESLAETFLVLGGASLTKVPVGPGARGSEAGETESSAKEGFAGGNEAHAAAIIRGVEFLLQAAVDGRHRVAWPIGFYFAKLWYHEKLYPLIFTVAALGKCLRLQQASRERSAR